MPASGPTRRRQRLALGGGQAGKGGAGRIVGQLLQGMGPPEVAAVADDAHQHHQEHRQDESEFDKRGSPAIAGPLHPGFNHATLPLLVGNRQRLLVARRTYGQINLVKQHHPDRRDCRGLPSGAAANMQRSMRRGPRPASVSPSGRPRLWGRHPVAAALANPERTVRRVWGTREALAAFGGFPPDLPVTYADVADLGRLVPGDAPHQGVVIEVDPLPELWLGDLLEQGAGDRRPLVVLDQVTDPHNVGAVLRSAAAFDALGIVTQDRHAPPESGALARAASGALEIVPWVRVVNLARALDEIGEAGYWRIGLTGHAPRTFAEAVGDAKVAVVLGAEGEGMRQNTEAHCDELAKLPISARVESLNISNAAAIALYALAARA
jgi:23S rRNA (guanosine2251-2'-O)-methyltransferase